MPAVPEHLTAKYSVDQTLSNSVDEATLVSNNQDKDLNTFNLTNISSITLNTQAVNDNQVNTKAYVDQFHQENGRSRRDVGLYFYNESCNLLKNNQDENFRENKLTNIDSITINRNPNCDNELANKSYADDSLAGDIF